jgi:membrane protein DedA with SNARE-associated domain
MTDWLLALVPTYGLWLIGTSTLAACLALPIPASVIMMAAGGFAAAGDLVLWQVMAAAFAGAVLGDQIGFAAGRKGGAPLLDRIGQKTASGAQGRQSSKGRAVRGRAGAIQRARRTMQARGGWAIFLSRCLFSPLGPYVNLIAGALGHDWRRCTLRAVLGQAVWCGLYVVMGRAFGGNLAAASDTLGSALGLVASGAAVLALGAVLLAALRRERLARRGLSQTAK